MHNDKSQNFITWILDAIIEGHTLIFIENIWLIIFSKVLGKVLGVYVGENTVDMQRLTTLLLHK